MRELVTELADKYDDTFTTVSLLDRIRELLEPGTADNIGYIKRGARRSGPPVNLAVLDVLDSVHRDAPGWETDLRAQLGLHPRARHRDWPGTLDALRALPDLAEQLHRHNPVALDASQAARIWHRTCRWLLGETQPAESLATRFLATPDAAAQLGKTEQAFHMWASRRDIRPLVVRQGKTQLAFWDMRVVFASWRAAC